MNTSSTPTISATDALVIVDVQNDFLPGGVLAVPAGDQIIAPLNRVAAAFAEAGQPVFATRDWHPPDHCSFRLRGGIWPAHCVAGTFGAEFAPSLRLPATVSVISKAQESNRDAYSGFDGTELNAHLCDMRIQRIYVGGLATDYCVVSTVRDALRLGFKVVVLEDCVRAVNVNADDGARAADAMRTLGAITIQSTTLGFV
jgi:nicotinamidase/pyrazinamidase